MSENVGLHSVSFADAPEVRPKQADVVEEAAPVEDDSVVEALLEDALDAREQLADELYQHALGPADLRATAVRLVGVAGLEDGRSLEAIRAWGETDPAGATAWIDARIAAEERAHIQAQTEEARRELEVQDAARGEAVAQFKARYPEYENDDHLVDMMQTGIALIAAEDPESISPSRVAKTLEELHGTVAQVAKAQAGVDAVDSFRSDFASHMERQRGFRSDAARGTKSSSQDVGGELKSALREVFGLPEPRSEERDAALLARIHPTAEERTNRVQAFREQFAAEAAGRGKEMVDANRSHATRSLKAKLETDALVKARRGRR